MHFSELQLDERLMRAVKTMGLSLIHIYLSVVVPAYQEERRIGPSLDAIVAHLNAQPYPTEIVVVGDGCTDNTAAVVRARAEASPVPIAMLDRAENLSLIHI